MFNRQICIIIIGIGIHMTTIEWEGGGGGWGVSARALLGPTILFHVPQLLFLLFFYLVYRGNLYLAYWRSLYELIKSQKLAPRPMFIFCNICLCYGSILRLISYKLGAPIGYPPLACSSGSRGCVQCGSDA